MRRKRYLLIIVELLAGVIAIWFFFLRLPSCSDQSPHSSLSSSHLFESKSIDSEPWHIPEWVTKYNVSHLFDWTWHKNGDFQRCRTLHPRPIRSSACRTKSSIVVNDPFDYFRTHSNEGCVVDDVARLPNLIPHPVPRARSFANTCSVLKIDREWSLCKKPQLELHDWLPSTQRFVTIAVFNAFVDWGSCHPDVPGTVFTERATFHLQRWTNKRCGNNPISIIPQIKAEFQHTELIDSIGNYLGAPGHFGPQQLPRLLRLLATAPATAKLLVAKGGVADSLLDVLIERGIVTSDRIVQFDNNLYSSHFADIVYRSEAWPYLTDKSNSHFAHDRTDMQLVHRVLATGEFQSGAKRDLIILIKRKEGRARSIIEHVDIATLISSSIKKMKSSLNLQLEIFEAKGHMRDHIDLFRRARLIVGSHGAGMMNIMWSAPRTHVVEVGYTTGMPYPEMYAEMSLHLEQRYWVCKGYGDYETPIHIDMDDFNYIFNQIISEIETDDAVL